jgi:hypothetical protein
MKTWGKNGDERLLKDGLGLDCRLSVRVEEENGHA